MANSNPHLEEKWELRLLLSKKNRDRYELLGTYPKSGMAWGMRQKFYKSSPKKYPLEMLWVEKVQPIADKSVQLSFNFDKNK